MLCAVRADIQMSVSAASQFRATSTDNVRNPGASQKRLPPSVGVGKVYQTSRGFELGTLDLSILAKMMKKQPVL